MKGIGQWARVLESQRTNWKPPHEKKKLKLKQVNIRVAELLIYQKCIRGPRVFDSMDHGTDPNYRNMVKFVVIEKISKDIDNIDIG